MRVEKFRGLRLWGFRVYDFWCSGFASFGVHVLRLWGFSVYGFWGGAFGFIGCFERFFRGFHGGPMNTGSMKDLRGSGASGFLNGLKVLQRFYLVL